MTSTPPPGERPQPDRTPSSGLSWAERRELLRNWRSNDGPVRADASAPKTEPAFNPNSWSGALILMAGATAVLLVVQIVNSVRHYSLDRFGLRPRRVDGLWGVLTQPFLHDSWGHLIYNSVSFFLIGWVLLLAGIRSWLIVSGIVLVVGGLLTWLVAPAGLIVGASSLVFGWIGYLIARAYFSRKLSWIITAIGVLIFFGGLLGQALPAQSGGQVSWQAHLCGFVAGLLAGAVLHPRRAGKKRSRRNPAAPPVS